MSKQRNENPESWYTLRGNQRFGPYPSQILVDWIIAGKVAPTDLVSNGGPPITAERFVQQRARDAALAQNVGGGFEPLEPEFDDVQQAGTVSDGDIATPPSEGAATKTSASSVAPEADVGPAERDRIVIVGRRQSGKTIYLASVYAKLWRSLDGMTAKALSGEVHRQLMLDNTALCQGRWPAATLGTARMEMEIEYRQKKRLMVTLDFAGELFRKAFVEEQQDWPGVKELVEHIDRAAAVILLVDPAVVAGMDHEAALDDDFGLVQAVDRIRNWPGGDGVPIVLVLTKMDQNQKLIDRFGSSKEFVRAHFPALVRSLKQIPIFQVSAVQTELDKNGRHRPRQDSQPINVDTPLRYCLKSIGRSEDQSEEERLQRERLAMEMRLEREERHRERRQTRLLAFAITTILVLGATAAVLVVLWTR